jgi:Protein of unknown function (DUF998)
MSERNGALAGMIGPAMFALIAVVVTVLQYNFLVGLGWDPVGVSDVPWPSALALGPYGFLQVLNFVLFGIMLMVFAAGLHRGVAPSGRVSQAGPAFLVVAGVALVLLGFKTDPHMGTRAHTWHGMIHIGAFLLLGLSFLLALLLMWRSLEKDPAWRGYGWYSLVSAVLALILFFVPGQVAVYFFFAVLLVWVEVVAIHLRSIAGGLRVRRSVQVR